MLQNPTQLVYLTYALAMVDLYLYLPQLETERKNTAILRMLVILTSMAFIYKDDKFTRVATSVVAIPLSTYLLIRLFKN
jgi:hypothetical protein